MNISMTYLGETIFVLAIVFSILGFYLGKRKTQTPVLVTFLAFFSALIPPIGLIFLMVLACKKDLSTAG
jgi:predicted PurR-regulated permease PerM